MRVYVYVRAFKHNCVLKSVRPISQSRNLSFISFEIMFLLLVLSRYFTLQNFIIAVVAQ